MDRCKETIKATTQLASNSLRLPLRQHYKSRFPALNCRRLRETFSTDTFFSTQKALGGATCAQSFAGKKSYLTECVAMQGEASFTSALQDFIR